MVTDYIANRPLTQEDYERLDKAAAEMAATLIRAIQPIQVTFTNLAEQIAGNLVPMMNRVIATFRKAYEDAGSPYGPSDDVDNVCRWLDELSDRAAAQWEANRVIPLEKRIVRREDT